MTQPSRPDAPTPAAASPLPPGAGVTVLVCSSCRGPGGDDAAPRPGARLVEDARAAAEGSGVEIRQVACLGNCRRGLSAAIFRDGCWTYVFGWLGTGSGADLVAGARLFAESSDGFMPFRARPEALKRGLVARIPNPDLLKDLQS